MPIDPEPAETTLSKVTRYVEFAIVAVLALAALGASFASSIWLMFSKQSQSHPRPRSAKGWRLFRRQLTPLLGRRFLC